jgi:hypothetical protein
VAQVHLEGNGSAVAAGEVKRVGTAGGDGRINQTSGRQSGAGLNIPEGISVELECAEYASNCDWFCGMLAGAGAKRARGMAQ